MHETWMRPNTRVFAFLLVVAGLFCMASLGVGFLIPNRPTGPRIARIVCFLASAALAGTCLWIGTRWRSPRLAYEDGHLIVNLGTFAPILVPIQLVEVFFLGQGPSLLPNSTRSSEGKTSETRTVVVRLAEKVQQWRHRPVAPKLGHWCDGYITIRGTWTEPITEELVSRLNSRLVEIHRQQESAKPREATTE